MPLLITLLYLLPLFRLPPNHAWLGLFACRFLQVGRWVGGCVCVFVCVYVFWRISVEIITGGGGKKRPEAQPMRPAHHQPSCREVFFPSSQVMHWDCSLSFSCLLVVRSESEKGT